MGGMTLAWGYGLADMYTAIVLKRGKSVGFGTVLNQGCKARRLADLSRFCGEKFMGEIVCAE